MAQAYHDPKSLWNDCDSGVPVAMVRPAEVIALELAKAAEVSKANRGIG
jgi:hypothetical protein